MPWYDLPEEQLKDYRTGTPEPADLDRWWGERLDQALGKIRSGDVSYIAAPDRDSYHTAWFELHQDLIGLAGTTRQKEAAAGRAL